MKDQTLILEEIIKIGQQMTQIKNIEILMDTILSEARKLVCADAGSFYICKDQCLHFICAQNDSMDVQRSEQLQTFSIPVKDKSISGYVALSAEVLNIDNVYEIPDHVPYSFYPEIDQKTGYHTQSMLTIPLKTPNEKVIGILQLINAKNEQNEIVSFAKEDEPFLNHFANIAAISLERAEMTRSLIMRMVKMAELRDPTETGPHVDRVATSAALLYEKWALSHSIAEKDLKENKDLIRMAAMLHDVGKVGISDDILKKNGKLTEDEYEQIKKHPLIGAKLFSDHYSRLDQMSMEIALNHHQRWDGMGYPDQDSAPMSGNAIPLTARIVSICDVYDALSSKRSYKEAWDDRKVWEEMHRMSAHHFDPELFDLFLTLKDDLKFIQKKYPDPSHDPGNNKI